MDAIKYLRQEHSKFRKKLRQISLMKNEITKLKAFNVFCLDLIKHEKMEQKTWYPVLRKDRELSDIIKHLLSEERSAEQAIKKLKKTEYGLIWRLRFYKFRHDVDHHARQEETELFPEVRKRFTNKELNTLGVKMRKFKTSLTK